MIAGIGWFVVVLAVWQMEAARRMFKKEKMKCAKYPLYGLRDKIILEIIRNPRQANDLMPAYDMINRIVHLSDRFNYRLISGAITEFTERKLKAGKVNPRKLSPFEIELGWTIIHMARRNSLLLRLATSKYGMPVLIFPVVHGVFNHFTKLLAVKVTGQMVNFNQTWTNELANG